MANLRLQLTVTDETETSTKLDVIFDPRARPVLKYNVMPLASDLIDETKFPPGCRLKIVLTFADSSTANMAWTVDTFRTADPKNLPPLTQILQDDQLLIQFSQRCFVSDSGYTTWRFRMFSDASASPLYNVTTQALFQDAENWIDREFPGSKSQISFRLAAGMQNGAQSGDEIIRAQGTQLFASRKVSSYIAVQFAPWDPSKFVYLTTAAEALDRDISIGNGLTLFKDRNDKDMTLWQPCVYDVAVASPTPVRSLLAGIIHISSYSVIKSWNENLARRYYDGLALNHAFTLLPELTLTSDPQHNWETLVSIQEHIPLSTSPNDWNWNAKDSTTEYPLANHADNILLTQVKRVRMLYGQTEPVSADLRSFRRQDGLPLHLDQLTLLSPPQNPDLGDRVVWKLQLTGSVDLTTKQDAGQAVRAGGFALHFLAASKGTPYGIGVTAEFGISSSRPTPGPLMPVVSCTLSPLPLWDCVPAAEDDLNGDQYAQLYVGTPGQNASGQNNSSVVDSLNEIYNNMQRDPSIVFRRPRMPKPGESLQPPADGQWYLQYAEQSSLTEKQFVSMQLLFTPLDTGGDPKALPDDSVLVFSRNPFSFADVHFHPLTSSAQQTDSTKVADWNSVSNEWQILQLNSSPSYMVLPPQVLGEENVTSDQSAPSGIGTDDKTLMAMGMPTVVTYAPNQTTNAVKLPWDLHRLTTDASLSVSRVDYEMLYGMVATTTADHMRLTEAASLYGDLLGEFPPLDLPSPNDAQYAVLLELRKRYLLARLHWSRIHREYRSRLGVFILQDSTAADPESFTDTTHTIAQLRLNNQPPDLSNGTGTRPPAQDYIQPSFLSDTFVDPNQPPPPANPGDPVLLKGGALNGVDVEGIFKGIVTNRSTGPGNAAVLNPRFSALGGFGTTRGTFNNGLSTLINTISIGRTVTYTVEQLGRIGCHWNRAKHVIVYERTVLPSRQFYNSQLNVAYRGIPLVRKVEEYVEFLQPDRIFSEESAAPQAAFASGFKCGEHKRISIDSAWGSVVPNQGWKVPLWNPAVAQPKTSTPKIAKGRKKPASSAQAPPLPDVYPKPQFYLEITSPEQTLTSSDQQPTFLTADALLTHPEQVFFYTSFVETTPDTDSWKPVETVDFVSYPLIGPDSDIYTGGDVNAVALPEFPTPPGWEAVTFSIAPPAVGINVTAGVVSTRTPMAAQLTSVTVTRGPRPTATTARTLLAKSGDPAPLKNYTDSAIPLATIPQAFAAMRATIKAELAAPNTDRTKTELASQVQQLQDSATNLQTKMTVAAADMASRFIKPYSDAAIALKSKISASANAAMALLTQINADLANPPAATETVRVAVTKHIQQTFQATASEVGAWIETDATKLAAMLDSIVRRWSNEIETALASYSVQFNKPIGTLSPLRQVTVAFRQFHTQVTALHNDVTELLTEMPGDMATLALAQDFNTRIGKKAEAWKVQFDATVSQFTKGLGSLQQQLSNFDPSVLLLIFHTAGLAGQLETLVDTALQASSWQAVAGQTEADALSALKQVLQPVTAALTDANNTFASIDGNLSQVDNVLQETAFDLLRNQDQVKQLYTLSLATLQTTVQNICKTPALLLGPLLSSCSLTPQLHCGFLDDLAKATSDALNSLANLLATWIGQEVPTLFGPLAPVAAALTELANQLANSLPIDFASVQAQLDSMSGQLRGTVQQAGQYIDQYVRQPLMAEYSALTPEATSAMRVLRAFGAPPQVPHLDIQPPVVGYLYDGVAARVPVTPILARANQAGQILNALGVHLPTLSLADSLIPATLKNFNLTDVLPNFAGLRLPGLFSGIKLPDIDNHNITLTHGWEPQTRRAWLQANVSVPFTKRMVVFNAGFASFVLTNSTFTAQSRIQNNGTNIQQSTSGSITGTWNIEIGDSNALISFANTTLAFDEHGKFQFLFKPDHLTLSDALKAITALIQTFSDPKSGFTYGITPTGVKCAFALPVPDTAALTSGFTGLKFSTSLALDFISDFTVTLAIGVSSKDRPFNFAIFILGGCGYLTAGVVYNISKGKFDPPMLEMAIGCSASLAIALGPISGGVYAQFAIEARNNGGGFSTGAFFQITGHVSICGILSVDLVFRLEASYGNSVMVASGHFSISVSLFMFSFSVSRDVSMQMGSGGQRSTRLNAPPLGSSAPRNLVAVLERPGEIVPGLADAFFSAGAPAGTLAHRYLQILL